MYSTYELWLAAANAALQAGYGLDYHDAGTDEDALKLWYADYLQSRQDVRELADEFARDYDLTAPDPWTAKALKAAHPIPAPDQ